jgi:DNA-binding NtrC family response regulator
MNTLCAHAWPGNVRELQNAVERAIVLADLPLIRVRDLPPVVEKLATGDCKDEEKQAAELAIPKGAEVNPGPATAASTAGTTSPAASGMSPAVTGGAPLAQGVVALKKFLRDQEAGYLRHVLSLTRDDKEEAARLLDISLATLYRKLAEDGD